VTTLQLEALNRPTFELLSPQKPVWGEPCNGCGYCCQNSACEISQQITGDSPLSGCSLLEWDGANYRCGAIRMAGLISAEHAVFLRRKLGVGFGCDSEAGSADLIAFQRWNAERGRTRKADAA
jgi:hypothetical protein